MKRYNMTVWVGGELEAIESADGEWVRYEDIKHLLGDVDGERYRALRDKGVAVSAWQDVGGVHWAVNGVEYVNLDDGADALLRQSNSPRGG